MDPTPFFDYARERQLILLRKRAGQAKPWTVDPVLRAYRFCNVFREDDKVTQHLRSITNKMVSYDQILLATILYRWFNRPETGDSLFNHRLEEYDWTPFQKFFDIYLNTDTYNISVLKEGILAHQPNGPYVTGAYCIIGAPHMPKLDGILEVFRMFLTEKRPFDNIQDGEIIEICSWGWREVADHCLAYSGRVPMETVWDWFRRYSRSGDFMAYEVVTDLYHTPLLAGAPDTMTWANAGPGAIRGLNRLHGRPLEQQHPKSKTNGEMQNLLIYSEDPTYWPQTNNRGSVNFWHMPSLGGLFDSSGWPAWDMRTVEHTLCEFDKYRRIPEGGKVKQVYRGG